MNMKPRQKHDQQDGNILKKISSTTYTRKADTRLWKARTKQKDVQSRTQVQECYYLVSVASSKMYIQHILSTTVSCSVFISFYSSARLLKEVHVLRYHYNMTWMKRHTTKGSFSVRSVVLKRFLRPVKKTNLDRIVVPVCCINFVAIVECNSMIFD